MCEVLYRESFTSIQAGLVASELARNIQLCLLVVPLCSPDYKRENELYTTQIILAKHVANYIATVATSLAY